MRNAIIMCRIFLCNASIYVQSSIYARHASIHVRNASIYLNHIINMRCCITYSYAMHINASVDVRCYYHMYHILERNEQSRTTMSCCLLAH